MMPLAVLMYLLLLSVGSWAAQASDRVALVIGNSNYQAAGILDNPERDAKDIAQALGRVGFDVRLRIDLNHSDMRGAIRQFAKRARRADIAAIYFAGHGMELAGENWLIPVDAKLETDDDVEDEAIPLKYVMGKIGGAKTLSLLILDACRNNPFKKKMRSVRGFSRSVSRGLERVEPVGNTLVAYAARDGTVALDGKRGANSPYAQAWLKHIETPNVDIRILLGRIRDEVKSITSVSGRYVQEPFHYGSLPGRRIELVKQPIADRPAATISKPKRGNSLRDELVTATTCDEIYDIVPRLENNVRLVRFAGRRFGQIQCRFDVKRLLEIQSEKDIKELQSGLRFLGFATGTPDGLLGSKTISAVRNFMTLERLEQSFLAPLLIAKRLASRLQIDWSAAAEGYVGIADFYGAEKHFGKTPLTDSVWSRLSTQQRNLIRQITYRVRAGVESFQARSALKGSGSKISGVYIALPHGSCKVKGIKSLALNYWLLMIGQFAFVETANGYQFNRLYSSHQLTSYQLGPTRSGKLLGRSRTIFKVLGEGDLSDVSFFGTLALTRERATAKKEWLRWKRCMSAGTGTEMFVRSTGYVIKYLLRNPDVARSWAADANFKIK